MIIYYKELKSKICLGWVVRSLKHFLSFDVGTTSMKCLLFDESFREVFFEEREYTLLTPAENIVELPANVYYDTLCACVRKMLSCGISASDVASITITTQGETLIPIDSDGNALSNAIVWIDGRAERQAEYINSKISIDEIYRTTGLSEINGAVPAAKLMWIRENKRDVYDKTYKFMLIEDYLIYKLTGRAVSEQSIVSSTAWFDIVNETYYDKLLSVCELDKEKLPEVLPCGEVVGNITDKASAETGLLVETVVVSGAMDQVSSAIGAGNVKNGIVTETTGTALVVGVTADKPNFDNPSKVTIYKHFNHGYLYMPYCTTAGIVLKWFRDELMQKLKLDAKEKGVSVYALIDELAKEAPAGSHGLVTLPHFAGKAGNSRAVGAVYGITLGTRLSDVARSVLESIGAMLCETIADVEAAGVEVLEIRSLGGGASSDIWCEIKAGITEKKIQRTTYVQTTALGAAILGSVAVGAYSSVDEAIAACGVSYNEFLPKSEDVAAYKKVYEKYLELYKALDKVF